MQTQAERVSGLHRSMDDSHLQAEGADTRREGQVDFTETLRTVTYSLRMQTQAEKVR
jgi:hypothetical protein